MSNAPAGMPDEQDMQPQMSGECKPGDSCDMRAEIQAGTPHDQATKTTNRIAQAAQGKG